MIIDKRMEQFRKWLIEDVKKMTYSELCKLNKYIYREILSRRQDEKH